MSLLLAQRDFARFTQLGFGVELTFKPTPVAASTIIKGFATKHHLSISSEGLPVNSKNTHCTIAESILVAAGYTVRNANGEVDLINHLVSYADSSEVVKHYKISETMPDETLGQITCFLSDYE